MKNTRKFQMNGKIYDSMSAIAKELGVSRVRPTQFDKYGITEITEITENTKVVEGVKVDKTEEINPVADTSEKIEEVKCDDIEQDEEAKVEDNVSDKAESSTDEESVSEKPVSEKPVEKTTEVADKTENKKDDDNKDVSTLEEYSKKLKKSSMNDLIKFAEEAKVDTCESIANEQIRRMRLTMALKAHYYPNEKLAVKKATGFKKVDLEILIKVADERGLDYKKIDHPAIQRMWVTKALVEAGVTVDSLPKEDK